MTLAIPRRQSPKQSAGEARPASQGAAAIAATILLTCRRRAPFSNFRFCHSRPSSRDGEPAHSAANRSFRRRLEGEERRRSEGTSLYRPSGGSYRFNRRNLPDGLGRYLIRCATITHEQLTVGGMLTGAARVRRVPETVGQPA